MAASTPEQGTYSSTQSTSNMSVNQSVIDQLTVMEKACAEIRKTLGLSELSAPSAPAKKPRAKKAPEPSGEKKAPSDWDVLLANTIEDMKASGWPEWTDADGVLWPASRLDTVTDKKGNSTEAYVFDGGDHDGKPPSRALGGMKRASFLKAQADPAAAEKAKAYRAKLAEKRAASSTGSAEKKEPVADETVESEDEKPKRKPQSEETKKAAAEKRAATIAKKAAEAAAAVAAAAQEDVIEDVESEAEPADAEPEPVKVVAKVTPKPAPVAAPKKIIKTAPKAAKKPVSLVMVEWVHEEELYKKNERGDVADMDGNFFGHWDGKEIDESASQPADWDNAELFFPPSE